MTAQIRRNVIYNVYMFKVRDKRAEHGRGTWMKVLHLHAIVQHITLTVPIPCHT
jgi:hypothetical protein